MSEKIRIFIFIPNNFETKHIGFIHGFTEKINGCLSFYITSNKVQTEYLNSIGYCSENTPVLLSKKSENNSEWFHINSKTGKVQIYNANENKPTENIQVVSFLYDYNAFETSDIIRNNRSYYGSFIETLVKSIQIKNTKEHSNSRLGCRPFIVCISIICILLDLIIKVCEYLMPIVKCSATLHHFYTTVITLKWILQTTAKEKRITLNVGNVVVARIVDIYVGYLLLQWFMQFEQDFERLLSDFAEVIIDRLRDLLKFLMGSPVGLKLNDAFNNTLGSFFLYHISLWKTFLHAMSPFLGHALHLLTVPGILGLTFQIALAADLLFFATFHVYCIYVYAARLYGFQVKGITSLWKLFIGRKYNPLRQRVDSYQYNNQQLFIGTLAFTILLFLLPTTTLYYSVFTAFRVCRIILDGLLLRARYLLQCLPLYVSILWLLKSSRASGSINLTLKKSLNYEPLMFSSTLTMNSWWKTIISYLPETLEPIPSIKWATFIQNIVTGNLF